DQPQPFFRVLRRHSAVALQPQHLLRQQAAHLVVIHYQHFEFASGRDELVRCHGWPVPMLLDGITRPPAAPERLLSTFAEERTRNSRARSRPLRAVAPAPRALPPR